MQTSPLGLVSHQAGAVGGVPEPVPAYIGTGVRGQSANRFRRWVTSSGVRP